jgi:hypothetical protein
MGMQYTRREPGPGPRAILEHARPKAQVWRTYERKPNRNAQVDVAT